MTTLEILQRVAENHNRIAQVFVSGDNAILIGDVIRDLRLLVQQLQADLEAEQQTEAEKEDGLEAPEEAAEQKE